MASEGPLSPTVFEESTDAYVAWTNKDNVASSDNAYATADLTVANAYTKILFCTGFGFSVGGLITGITVEVERKASAVGTTYPRLFYCRLRYNGQYIGDTKTGTVFTTSDAYETVGGSSDVWGTSFSEEMNDASFGIGIGICTYGTPSGPGSCTVSVDHVRITITYTAATAKAQSDLVASVTETIAKATQSFDYSTANNNQAYLLNLKTGYWTFQDNCPITNAIFRPSTRQMLGSRRDVGQITRLDYGSTFDGTPIDSVIKTGDMNLGELDEVKATNAESSEAIKKMRAIFNEIIGEGNLTLKIYSETDSTGISFTIVVPTTDNVALNVIRTALSRNLKGKYYIFEWNNSSGNNFWIGETRIKIIPRKLK